ncbi:DUF4307 domain-containing protein [Streptomyces sp. TRM66268-LWL]|uniref:DUF4307 domain-containing protein n=1 Tax=Streptomyces polyasparticus TaxID=2767826 RepID=A0ABR7ST42_9ACTN|nr:DUF4307 domain-containing protein [Streptomyces polyasparticus]MBC9717701.1 DUF4307 domain-containing protein [Streptomyces polyasparticus]
MSSAPQTLPEARYGASSDERADRKLKIIGAVLGVLLLGIVGWFGYDYISGKKAFSGELIASKVVSASEVEVKLDIRKDAGTSGVCTVRALAESGAEVGRKDVAFDQRTDQITKVFTLRTTEKATAAELVSCTQR